MPRAGRFWPPASRPPTWSGGPLLLPEGPTWWVPLLSAPLALLALIAPLTQRWAAGIAMLVITSLGIATAFAAVGVWVSFSQSIPVPLWPGTGLSLAWLGALGGALVALDAGLAPRLRLGQGARRRGRVHRCRGARHPLAHLDGARCRHHHQRPGQHAPGLRRRGGPRRRRCRNDRAHAAECRRSVGAHRLGRERDPRRAGDHRVDAHRADGPGRRARRARGRPRHLVRRRRRRPARRLGHQLRAPRARRAARVRCRTHDAALGVDSDRPARHARRRRRHRQGHAVAGDLGRRGPRRRLPARSPRSSRLIAILQFGVVAIALLLALPTAASRRAARRTPRVVGPHWREGR